MSAHTISIVENTASVVTARLCIETYPGDFLSRDEAVEYAEDYARKFPWGWVCSCGLTGNGYHDAANAAFNAPDEHRHLAGDPSTVVVVVDDATSRGGAST